MGRSSNLLAVLGALFVLTGCPGDDDDSARDDDTEGPVDADGDGYTDITDCDDMDPLTFPGATEQCDGLDNDCDYVVPTDEIDGDGDGMSGCAGDCDDTDVALNRDDLDGDGFDTCDGDCDDGDPDVNPDQDETTCDGVDNDCDPTTEDAPDVDGDGNTVCDDCDDTDPALNFNDLDGDGYSTCDDDCDDDHPGLEPADADGDGFSTCDGDCVDDDPGLELLDTDGDGYSTCDGDCNDADPELDLADSDNDGATSCWGDCDDDDATLNLLDDDGDGVTSCNGDCDDSDPGTLPGAPEICDGIDNDCDGSVPQDEVDDDGDGASECESDCDDTDAQVYVGAPDVCDDHLDNDCDGLIDPLESDDDGDGVSECDGDADDIPPDLLAPAAVFLGEAAHDEAGSALAGGGDVDGDGFDDIIIGAASNNDAGADAGKVYLVRGAPALPGSMVLSSADEQILGEDHGDDAGYAVAMAGDVDGDGLDDVLVGAYQAGGTGKAYLLYGPVTGITSLADADAIFQGESASDHAGYSVDGAGDMNADGYDDIAVGAYMTAPGGTVYVIHGPSYGSHSLAAADARLEHADAGSHGRSVSAAGDMDNDGYDDIVTSAPSHTNYPWPNGFSGSVYLFRGPVSGEVWTNDADAHYVGPHAYASAGFSVAGAGDLNGDGFSDVMFTEYEGDGEVRIYFGAATVSLNANSPDSSISLDWPSVGGVGDVDGDGYDDILVGSGTDDTVTIDAGAAFLFLEVPLGNSVASDADAVFYGEAGDDWAGSAVSAAGDVDGDGYDDFVVSAPGNDDSYNNAGKVYLFFGG